MRALTCAFAGIALLAAANASAEPTPEDLAAAARAADCPPAKVTPPFGLAPYQQLEHAPDGVDGKWVIATVNPDGLAEKGAFCIGLLQGGEDSPYVRVAANRLTVQAEVTPAHFTLSIDSDPYAISPDVTAFGVTVWSEVNTESVDAGGGDFYLFRRSGDRLAVIFQASIADWNVDKVSHRTIADSQAKLRVSPHMTRGFRDLIVATPHARSRRFEWTGDRYEEVRHR